MWRHYLTIGFRALARSKTYAFINLVGLVTGLAACLLLLLYVRYESSYDRWLPNAANVYQLQNFSVDRETGDHYNLQMSQYVAGTALGSDFPEVEARSFVLPSNPVALRGGEALSIDDGIITDGPFFDVLALPLVRGDPASALARPGNLVLSQTEARRLFGSENVVGRTLTLVQRGEHVDYRVGGVLRDLPRNSHLRMGMIARVDPARFLRKSRVS